MRRDIHGWRLATIDVGSNAVLLLIVEVSLSGTFLVLEECSEVTRIGEGVDQSGLLGECGQNRTMKTLNNYFSLCNDFGVSEVNIVGTSALRASDNAVDFKNRLQMDLGWDLRILSPEEEACYSYLAVQRGLQPGGDEILVVDVGGGSTEFIWGKGGDLFQWASIEMGSVRLTERFFYSDPVTEKECEQLTKAVAEETKNLKSKWKITRPFHLVVGVAGTFTTLATVEKNSFHTLLLSFMGALWVGLRSSVKSDFTRARALLNVKAFSDWIPGEQM